MLMVAYNKAQNFFTKYTVVIVGAILCCLLWGSAFPCVKIGYTLFGIDKNTLGGAYVPSIMLFAGLRFMLAGVMVIAFGCILNKKMLLPKKRNIWRIGVLCVFQTVAQYIFFYIGLANTEGVKSAVLNGLGVFFTILSACFIFRTEKFNLVKLIGCALGFLGVVLINIGGSFTFDFSFTGEGFIILSGISSALSSGLVKIFSKEESTTTLCGYQFLCGGVVLIIIGFAFGGRVAPEGVVALLMLLYLAFISSFAFTLQGYLVKYNPISKVAVFKCTNPLFGAAFSAIAFVDERARLFSITTLFALLLVCIGIFIINKFGEKDFPLKNKRKI